MVLDKGGKVGFDRNYIKFGKKFPLFMERKQSEPKMENF